MMDALSLKDRYEHLLEFAHSRNDPVLTDEQVADKSGVSAEVLAQIRTGLITELPAHQAVAIATSLGLDDGSFLSPLNTNPTIEGAVVLHETLQMYIEARELGVERLAARDTTTSPTLVRRVREHLRGLAEDGRI